MASMVMQLTNWITNDPMTMMKVIIEITSVVRPIEVSSDIGQCPLISIRMVDFVAL